MLLILFIGFARRKKKHIQIDITGSVYQLYPPRYPSQFFINIKLRREINAMLSIWFQSIILVYFLWRFVQFIYLNFAHISGSNKNKFKCTLYIRTNKLKFMAPRIFL